MDIANELDRAIRTIADFPKPGIQFKDITPLLSDRELLHKAVLALAAPFEEQGITKVMGIEARGFLLGPMLAHHLGAGFVPVRKRGKLPYDTFAEEYELEYGLDAIEIHTDALHSGDRVLVHDDVIATGGTAAATLRLAEKVGGQVLGCSFLIELAFLEGRRHIDHDVHFHAVLKY
jgi:adenine phosphoribosyltransferase